MDNTSETPTGLPPAPPTPAQKSSSSLQGDKRMYPLLSIPYNEHPNRLLAIPIVAYLVRIILVIPQFFMIIFAGLGFLILFIIVPFAILFTGRYPDFAYNFILAYQKMYTKLYIYIFGLTDKYPGFSFDESKLFQLEYTKPATSSRLLAFPILGFIIRFVLLIPFFFWVSVLEGGAFVAVVCSWFIVLFTGRYPESLYEFVRDFLRVTNSNVIYFAYLSDTYPSFRISMNHKPIKIILLIIGIIYAIFNFFSSGSQDLNNAKHPDNFSNQQPLPGY